ncbi:MFS transporter [Dictyobacter alpinus]|uniref:MFS transporter n=1 Tax=Dictyobacter alpinus TaxID=2014873 RepID=A0A402BGM6_9CHLR|nr:MFS transporter [Dictyobacter alpinus]GCE30402.1 MFS transporter [Dictyobacter alpinus]
MKELSSSPEVTTKQQAPRSRYPRYVFILFCFINLLNFLDRNIFTGASNAIAKDLHLSLDQVGYIASAFLIVYTLATIPLGLWADHSPRKNVAAFCVAVWSIATACTSLVSNFTLIFLSRMVLGIGEAGYYPAGTALLSDYFRRDQRARVMSVWGVAQYTGIFIGFAVGGVLGAKGLWRQAFLVAALPGLVAAFLVWRMREPRRNQADEEALLLAEQGVLPAIEKELPPLPARPTTSFAGVLKQCWELLHIKTLIVLIVVQTFAFFVLSANVTYLPLFLQQRDTFNLSQEVTGIYSGGVIILAGIIGNLSGGFFADRLERRFSGARVLVSGLSFLVSAPVFVVAVLAKDFTVFTVFLFLTVFLLAIYGGPCTAATQDVVPSWLRSSSIAVSMLFAHLLGDAFSPAIIGIMATKFDPTHGQHFAQNLAGRDLGQALLITCTPALVLAGLAGIFGSRWMKADVDAALEAEKAGEPQSV